MASFYPYLISSLPTLHFGARPSFPFEKFIEHCQRYIPGKDAQILKKVSIGGEYNIEAARPALKKWQDFDTSLRNELIKIRSSRKHIDPAQYLRREKFPEQSITHTAIAAFRSTSLLEAEKILDQERWRILDEVSFGHYFDLDSLIVYALKLLILERWEIINTPDKGLVLEEALR